MLGRGSRDVPSQHCWPSSQSCSGSHLPKRDSRIVRERAECEELQILSCLHPDMRGRQAYPGCSERHSVALHAFSLCGAETGSIHCPCLQSVQHMGFQGHPAIREGLGPCVRSAGGWKRGRPHGPQKAARGKIKGKAKCPLHAVWNSQAANIASAPHSPSCSWVGQPCSPLGICLATPCPVSGKLHLLNSRTAFSSGWSSCWLHAFAPNSWKMTSRQKS